MVLWEALDALSHQFELCKIDSSTRVVTIVDADSDASYRSLLRAALARSGADAVLVSAVGSTVQSADRLAEQDLLPLVLDAADVVIVACQVGPEVASLLHQVRAQVLHLGPNAGSPQDYSPHANLRRRVQRLTSQLQQGAVLQLRDGHGTDLTINLGEHATDCDYGIIDDETATAHFPAGWVRVTPAVGTVQGDVVVMPGDANVTGRRLMSSPLRLEIRNDLITVIGGDNPDADVLRAQLEFPGEPSAYGVAGLAVGLNPGPSAIARFDERLLDDNLSRLAAGVVTVTFGANLVADRPCTQTVTVTLAHRDVHVDGLPICVNGNLEGDFAPDVYEG